MGNTMSSIGRLCGPNAKTRASIKSTKSDRPPSYERTLNADVNVTPEYILRSLRAHEGMNVVFHYQHGDPMTSTGWLAKLWIKAPDIPHLMKSGLGCLRTQVKQEAGSIQCRDKHDPPFKFAARDWTVRGLYELYQSKDQDSPRWGARLIVYGYHLAPVSRFRVEDLTTQNCTHAGAWSEDGVVYLYSKCQPWLNFNAIYDDMPLGNLWPWPEPKPKEHEAGGAEVFEG